MLKSIFAMAFLLTPQLANAGLIPNSTIISGNWSGAAYDFDGTRSFSHCAISASYKSGDTLMFSVNYDATVTVGVVSAGLTGGVGETFPVRLFVDQKLPISGSAEIVMTGMATLKLADLNAALESFKRGRLLKIQSPLGWSNFDLSGTFKALSLATDCAINYSRTYTPQAASGAHPAQTAVVASIPSQVDKTVLYQVATSLISDMKLTDFKYLSESESVAIMPSPSVIWRSESSGLIGAVTTSSISDGIDLSTSDADDISKLATGCQGEFAVSVQPVSDAGTPMRQIKGLCVVGDDQRETLVTKIQYGNVVLSTALIRIRDGNSAQASDLALPTTNDYLKAASFVKQ